MYIMKRTTMEEALRRAANQAEGEQERRAEGQLKYLQGLASRVDLEVLAGDQMWR
jgi:hypothetical protein